MANRLLFFFLVYFVAMCMLHGSDAESDYAKCRTLLDNNLCNRCFPESNYVRLTRQRYQFADDGKSDSVTSSTTAKELTRIASLVQSRLVRGACATEDAYSRMGLHDEDDEHPSMFIEEVYGLYGVDGFMNTSGFEHLLKDLDIGKEASAKTSDAKEDMGLLNQLRKHIGGEKQEEVRGESTERHVPNPGDETVGKCYSGSSLLRLFNLTAGIPRDSFGKICPSLVEQITHSCKPAETTHDQLDPEMYGWATLAVVTITALSMLAMVAVPTSGSRFYATVMQLFVSLAVSSLSGDALLHLLPEALGIHGLPKEEGEPNQILVILTVVIAIYFFFVFERVMSLCLRGKPLGHGHVHSRPRRETFVGEDEFEVRSAVHQVAVYDEVKLKDKSEEDRNEVKQKIGELNGDQIQTADDSEQAPKKTIFGLNTLVVMVLVGDIVHNITDGVTIGVSFVNGPFAGVSTAIAVFFHEVPHEIGDFAVMLRSGVSFKKAMFLSLISNLIGFVGLYAGLFLGSENVMQRWIYAATAGMFLYIALVSLIPEMNQQAEEASGSPWMVFMRHNVGLLTGWFIMLFIGFFEQYKDQGKI